MYRFQYQIDTNVSGFLQVLSEIIEHWYYKDDQWTEAYDRLSQGTIRVGGAVISKQDFSWRREGRWGYPLTCLEWRKMIHFGAPGMPADRPLSHTKQQRLLDNGEMYKFMETQLRTIRTRNGHVIRVDDKSDDTLHEQLETNDQLILMYGLNFIAIPTGASEGINLETVKEEEVVCLLFSLALAISVLLVAKTWWYPVGFALMAAVPLYKKLPQRAKDILRINHLIQTVDEDDWEFCRRVSRDAANIEVASRVLRDQFVANTAYPNRTLDVLLFHRNRRAWCRCQPNTHGNIAHRGTRNTWIEFCIPTQTPWRNRAYYFLYRLANTVVPWGHNDNWLPNLIYAFLVELSAASTYIAAPAANGLIAPTVAFFLLWIPKWLPNLRDTPWGEGDVTVIAWYVLLLRIVIGDSFGGPILKVVIFVWTLLKATGAPVPALPPWWNSSTPQMHKNARSS
ncbi:hypothetical protein BDV24DRAFT_169661 [Aspergillus arachidicola]|uniref:Uncharacterized protein n=1 Tax=Aspergillus arachidicola TaxID=656916 RepID=A0A5N6XRK3_9EURO|nr:hypothetical protein BDV24DRAFT_169661 [Aspergillus arachidicola]